MKKFVEGETPYRITISEKLYGNMSVDAKVSLLKIYIDWLDRKRSGSVNPKT